VRSLCQRIIVMNSGAIVEQGTASEILDQPRQQYTRQLVRAAFAVEA
jgi:ABC-type microcin C transport system duplicated ATPase subunit YejF